MKKLLSMVLVCLLLVSFALFALGSSSDDETVSQESGTVSSGDQTNTETEQKEESNTSLGDYKVEIKSCRLAKNYEKKPVVIVTYSFTNEKSDTASSFYTTIEDNVYQNGIGLNESYIVDESYNYSSDNSMKEIKKGATLDVEVAYELNEETTPIDVEVKEYFSFSDKVITKQFALK